MLPKFFCILFDHPYNHIRERMTDGTMGYRCENCLTILPNTIESITGIQPPNPDYKPGKAELLDLDEEIKLIPNITETH